MKCHQHTTKFEQHRIWWADYRILAVDGLTRIALLGYPSSTTEHRATQGALGQSGGKPKVPTYKNRPSLQVRIFDKSFRALTKFEQLAVYCKYVLEATNKQIGNLHGYTEGKVRRDLKNAEKKQKTFLKNL